MKPQKINIAKTKEKNLLDIQKTVEQHFEKFFLDFWNKKVILMMDEIIINNISDFLSAEYKQSGLSFNCPQLSFELETLELKLTSFSAKISESQNSQQFSRAKSTNLISKVSSLFSNTNEKTKFQIQETLAKKNKQIEELKEFSENLQEISSQIIANSKKYQSTLENVSSELIFQNLSKNSKETVTFPTVQQIFSEPNSKSLFLKEKAKAIQISEFELDFKICSKEQELIGKQPLLEKSSPDKLEPISSPIVEQISAEISSITTISLYVDSQNHLFYSDNQPVLDPVSNTPIMYIGNVSDPKSIKKTGDSSN